MTLPRYIRRARLEVFRRGARILEADESLRMAFSIRRDAAPDTQPSTITLYNLSEQSESLIEESGDSVRLQAGYQGGDLGIVGEGEIRRVDHDTADLDRLMIIAIGQSDVGQVETLNVSYKNIGLKTIIRDIVDGMGLRAGPTFAIVPSETLAEWAFIGRGRDALSELLRPRGIRWWELNGEVQFATDEQAAGFVSITISEDTGLIGSPSRTERGIRLKTVLEPAITPNALMRLESARITGEYRTIVVQHVGDTWQGEFATEVEAVPR